MKKNLLISLSVTAICILPALTSAQPGTYDNTFGTSSYGSITTYVGTSTFSKCRAIAIQNDDKIVAAGLVFIAGTPGNQDFAVVRFTANGRVDSTFGTIGKVITPVGNGAATDLATSVVIQSDGKIVVAGSANTNTNGDFAVVRYTTSGGLDSTFGTGGKVITPIGSSSDLAYSAALQSDGKIVVAGSSYDANAGSNDIALIRYKSDGSLDSTFGTNGKVITSIGSGNEVAYSVALQSDGKIVAAGYSRVATTDDFAVVRYNSNGTLDNTFGTGGIRTTPVGSSTDQANCVAIQSDGKIVVGGYSYNGTDNDFAVVRYTSNGVLDNTFGTGGKTTTAVDFDGDEAHSVAIESDGKILLAGRNYMYGNEFAMVRYNSNGIVDSTFGNYGRILTYFGTSVDDMAYSVAIQSTGKIVLGGYASNSSKSQYRFALSRYNGGSSPVGLEEADIENGLHVYPNPTSGVCRLSTAFLPCEGTAEVYSYFGKKVSYLSLEKGSDLLFDLSAQPNGMYLLWIKTTQGVISKKIIIQK